MVNDNSGLSQACDSQNNLSVPDGYSVWKKKIIGLIEQAKYNAELNVYAELLSLYWKIGSDIIKKQELFADVASALPQIEDLDDKVEDEK